MSREEKSQTNKKMVIIISGGPEEFLGSNFCGLTPASIYSPVM